MVARLLCFWARYEAVVEQQCAEQWGSHFMANRK